MSVGFSTISVIRTDGPPDDRDELEPLDIVWVKLKTIVQCKITSIFSTYGLTVGSTIKYADWEWGAVE